MIRTIAIENFKGIGERVSLELKPITLLFGPNSAGKSTILHALHYAREILERHNLDPDQTITGGKYIDLGGFGSFVHNHDNKNVIGIRIDSDVGDRSLSAFVEGFSSVSTVLGVNVREIVRKPKTVGVQLSIAWSELEECPYVARIAIYADESLFVEISASPNLRSVLISKLVIDHPFLIRRRELVSDPTELELSSEETILAAAFKECFEVVAPGDGERIELSSLKDALPRLDRPLVIEYTPFSSPEDDEGKDRLETQLNVAGEISDAISDVVIGTISLIREELAHLCYLGPFRETPSRHHIPPRFPDPARWATGLAAWDRLFGNNKIVQEVNSWLSGPDSLQIGYKLRLKEFKEIPLNSPLMVLLRSERAFDDLEDIRRQIDDYPTRSTLCLVEEDTDVEVLPHDVGIGISQLIPVVVLALGSDARIAAVEQPELHMHPGVQVRLGDLFIHQIASDPTRIFILETHSEHLMLRLLRRIRETTEEELPPGHPGLSPDKVTVIYVEEGEPRADAETAADLNSLLLTPLRIDATGEFQDRWPHGFFEERGEELFGK